jgi:hypothetical protein
MTQDGKVTYLGLRQPEQIPDLDPALADDPSVREDDETFMARRSMQYDRANVEWLDGVEGVWINALPSRSS